MAASAGDRAVGRWAVDAEEGPASLESTSAALTQSLLLRCFDLVIPLLEKEKSPKGARKWHKRLCNSNPSIM